MEEPKNKHTLALISNLTHQAINPLNGVMGTLDNLIDGTIQGPERKEQRLRSARSQLEFTVSLIRNLAYFAEYGTEENISPKFKTNKTCIIPQTLIEAVQFFQEQGVASEIRIEILDRHIQNAVNGDPELLKQVFMNLFDNYVKYGLSNSTVEVKNWIQKNSNNLILEFSGESTPFSTDENIFEAGIRGKAARQKTSSGSGLGLHVCKLIIERLFKGTITANYISAKKLATFEIRIPDAFLKKGR